MKVITSRNFILNGTPYTANNEIEIKDKKLLLQLNSKGFIRPLTNEEIQSLNDNVEKEQSKKKFRREEEDIRNDRRYYKD